MKTKFPSAVSLTQKQINWLRQQPNGSELIGKIIDAMMILDRLSPDAFQSVQLHLKLERLKEIFSDTQFKRQKLLQDNGWHFKQTQRTEGRFVNSYIDNPDDPIPTDDEGRLIMRLLSDYDVSIKQLQSEIQKVTAQIMQPTEQHVQSDAPLPQTCSP